jgi:hypothetical protein
VLFAAMTAENGGRLTSIVDSSLPTPWTFNSRSPQGAEFEDKLHRCILHLAREDSTSMRAIVTFGGRVSPRRHAPFQVSGARDNVEI